MINKCQNIISRSRTVLNVYIITITIIILIIKIKIKVLEYITLLYILLSIKYEWHVISFLYIDY
jgi:hypothetical protein